MALLDRHCRQPPTVRQRLHSSLTVFDALTLLGSADFVAPSAVLLILLPHGLLQHFGEVFLTTRSLQTPVKKNKNKQTQITNKRPSDTRKTLCVFSLSSPHIPPPTYPPQTSHPSSPSPPALRLRPQSPQLPIPHYEHLSASRLVHAMSAGSVKTRHAPSPHCRGARVHTTMLLRLRQFMTRVPGTTPIPFLPPPPPTPTHPPSP